MTTFRIFTDPQGETRLIDAGQPVEFCFDGWIERGTIEADTLADAHEMVAQAAA